MDMPLVIYVILAKNLNKGSGNGYKEEHRHKAWRQRI